MTHITDKYTGLSSLFGFALYDNENWEEMFGTPQKTIYAYLSDPENDYGIWSLEALLEEIDTYLATDPSEAQIFKDLVRLCSGYFYPEKNKGKAWLLSIREVIMDVLKQAQKENRL